MRGSESIVAFLLTMQPPRDLTRILWWHFRWLEDRFLIHEWWLQRHRRDRGDPQVRGALGREGSGAARRYPALSVEDERLSPESDPCITSNGPRSALQKRTRNSSERRKCDARLISLGLYKKPITEREKRKIEREKRTNEIRTLLQRLRP